MKSEDRINELLAEYRQKTDQISDQMKQTHRNVDMMSRAIAEQSITLNEQGARFNQMRAEFQDEMKEMRGDFQSEMKEMRGEFQSEIKGIEMRFQSEMKELKIDIRDMKQEQNIMLKELISLSKRVTTVEDNIR